MSALTLDEVKQQVNITVGADDAELQAMLDRAEAAVGTKVGPLTPVTVTERVWATPNGSLMLSYWPVVSLTSVTPYGGTALDLTDVDYSTGVLSYVSGAAFSITSTAYTVVYQYGWATIPKDVELAVLEMVRHFWQTQRGAGKRPGSAPAEEVGNRTPGAAYLFPIRVEQLLGPYRAPQAG